MIYESNNSLYADLCKFEENSNFSFPMHLHDSFEFITVTDGEMKVTVESECYTLHRGEGVLVFPNQVHSLSTEESSSHFLCIFSPKLVHAYSSVYSSLVPKSSKFIPDNHTLDRLLALATGEFGALHLKGVLYSLCAEFDDGAEYVSRTEADDGLLKQIFLFVEREYARDCSLQSLAEHTRYHYVYLSRYFKKCTGISFTEYVVRYRINEACYMLKNGAESVLRTAYDSGFDSLRSFNRNFKRIVGKTPMEYRSE